MRGSSNTAKVPAKPFNGFSGCTYGLIDFRYNGSLRPGVGLSDCFSKANLGMLSNGDEHVLQDREAIRLYLSWPGYSTANTYVTIRCGPTTRARLAYEVSNHVAAFLQKCASMPISSSSAQWRVGAGGITPNNVILTTVIDMGNGIWQAELEVAF